MEAYDEANTPINIAGACEVVMSKVTDPYTQEYVPSRTIMRLMIG